MYETAKDIIRSIDRVNRGIQEQSIDIGISNEVCSSNYIDCTYKLIELSKHSYDNYHFSIDDRFYEAFIYRNELTDTDNLYQVILCNNYTQIYKFKQSDYSNRQMVGSFKNPGRIYSFLDGSILIVQNDRCLNFNYEKLIP